MRESPRSPRGLLAGIAALLLLATSAAPAAAQGTGVTVTNVPPQFSAIKIYARDGLNYIDVVVSDYNSWEDIFQVRVLVLDKTLAPLADILFQQYPTNTTPVAQPAFIQPVGDYLVQDLSSASHSNQTATIPQRTDLHVTLVLSPVKADWVNVTAVDLGGLRAYAQVQYQTGFIGGLPPIAGWVLMMVAAVFAVFVVGRRIRREYRGV